MQSRCPAKGEVVVGLLGHEAPALQGWRSCSHGEKQGISRGLAIDVDDELFAHFFYLRDPTSGTSAIQALTDFPEFRQEVLVNYAGIGSFKREHPRVANQRFENVHASLNSSANRSS